jgi:NAD(P)H-hydrate epimerase
MDESLLMGLYAAASMRAVDAAAIDGLGIPGGHLMERAGAAVADEILERFDPESVVVYAGKGNNGGDGFVVARELFNAGCDVVVYAIAGRAGYKGDALLNLKILDQLGVEVREGIGEDDDLTLELADVVVDAIFGTGFTGAAKGVEAAAIERIDQAAAVVSIDIASGVGASTGTVHGPVVEADLTVALHAAKVGHFVTPGGAFSGEVVIAPIGIPPICDRAPEAWLLTAAAVADLIRPKGSLDHKRSVGTVTVVGGSRGMTGAANLTAMAALRAGAGTVHCLQPLGIAGPSPFVEVITVPVPGDDRFAAASLAAVKEEAARFRAMAVGPGLGRAADTQKFVRSLLAEDVPLLIDADGLYALGDKPELLAGRGAPTVLTPHEGELGRLLGLPAEEVAAGRLECVRSAAKRGDVTVVLKGEASIVADPSGAAYVIPTGNPGLATPGTGDVLSGVIVAQLAKGLPATEAACLGGFVHGLAADLAAEHAVGTEGMVASDLLEFLPQAIEWLKGSYDDDDEHDD